MPGSTGGGNSGSFSGGSSGNSGGFSSGSMNSGSMNTGGIMPMHTGSSGGHRHGGRRGSSPLGIILFVLIAGFFMMRAAIPAGIIGGLWSSVKNIFDEPSSIGRNDFDNDFDFDYDIDGETPRTRLPANKCTRVDDVVIDGDGILTENERARLTSALDKLYDITGVQSVAMFRREVSTSYDPSYGDIDEFMYTSYTDLFDDEGHVLFLFVIDAYGNYTNWYICGDDTVGVFDASDASEILSDIDFYAESNAGMANSICSAFETAAVNLPFEPTPSSDTETASEIKETESGEAIVSSSEEETAAEMPTEPSVSSEETAATANMTEEDPSVTYPMGAIDPGDEKNGTTTALIVFFSVLLAVVIIAFAVHFALQKHKERTSDENYDAHIESDSHSHSNSNPYYADDGSLPVRCPNCGALGALTADGRCRYCGEKLK